MTKLQKALITAAFIAAAGTGIFEARQASTLRAQVQTLQQQQAPLTDQIQQLQRERDDAANRLAALAAEMAGKNGNSTELLRLRGEVTRFRDAASQEDDPFVQTALAWKAKEAKLRKLFGDRPGQGIPEMQFLTEREWLDIARDSDLDSKAGISTALSSVRNKAKQLFVPRFQKALNKYTDANNGTPPNDLSLLRPYFDPPVDDALLQRYELLDKKSVEWQHGAAVIEKAVIDTSHEGRVEIGRNWSRVGSPEIQPGRYDFPRELAPVLEAYGRQNNGKRLEDFSELKPYITTPEQNAALEKYMSRLNR